MFTKPEAAAPRLVLSAPVVVLPCPPPTMSTTIVLRHAGSLVRPMSRVASDLASSSM
jgi:hypothetical protein